MMRSRQKNLKAIKHSCGGRKKIRGPNRPRGFPRAVLRRPLGRLAEAARFFFWSGMPLGSALEGILDLLEKQDGSKLVRLTPPSSTLR